MIETFLYLLRCGLSDTVPDIANIPDDIQWGEMMMLAQDHTVVGVVADALSRIDDPDPDVRSAAAAFERAAYSIVQTNLRLNNIMVDVLDKFQNQGIECILLKGQGVAANYPNPILRQSGDIDIYVPEHLYDKAHDYAHEVMDPQSNDVDEHEVHYGFGYGGVSIELHRILMRHPARRLNSILQEWTIHQMDHGRCERVSVNGKFIKLPPVDLNAFFLFYHAWYHFLFEGVGLRQICDWTLFLKTHKDQIDISVIDDMLQLMHLRKQWQIMGCIAVDALGLDIDDMPLYDERQSKLAESVLREIIYKGNFGYCDTRTHVPDDEGLIDKFKRVASFTIRNHMSMMKYDRVLNRAMLREKLGKKARLLVRLLFRNKTQ